MNPDVEEKLGRCKSLPTLPIVAVRVLELCQAPEPDIKKILQVIGSDAALASRLLRMANTPMVGARREVATLSHSVAMLGLNAVKTMALSFAVAGAVGGNKAPWIGDYWKRSALSAAAARLLGKKYGPVFTEEVFLAALLQDIGVLGMSKVFKEQFDAVMVAVGTGHEALSEAEKVAFGADHAEIGAWLVDKWQLPAPFVQSTKYSHHPAAELPQGDETEARLARVVATSSRIAEVFMDGDRGPVSRRARDYAREALGMEEEAFTEILELLKDNANEVLGLMDIPAYDPDDIFNIVEEAREALVMMSVTAEMNMQKTVGKLEERAIEAERASITDELTQITNRAGFKKFLSDSIMATVRARRPLGMLMVDVDHFKKFNDTHGHLAGDAVLKAVAQALAGAVRPDDLAARYGGEEFVALLPNSDGPGALIVGERMRKAIESLKVDVGEGKVLSVTASFGAAVFDPRRHPQHSDFIEEADKALYEAKHAGRNRVVLAQASQQAPKAAS